MHVHRQTLSFPKSKSLPARKLRFLDRVRASGTAKFSQETLEAIPSKYNSKDEDPVFVAGATGRVGSRTVRELLKLGFRVRAGVRSAQRAETLVQSVKEMKLNVEAAADGFDPVEKLEIVECDLEKQDQIGKALGPASAVICCIGASEKEVFDITGPYRIDYQATKNLIDAATVAKVNHFILLTSLGTNKVGFPAAVLNLFWGVLIWKRKAEEALLASGLPYTIVRPGGMERPTDAYKETHNITLSNEDTLFGGQVSNLQVAELMAFMAKNRKLSHCKVVEVIAETTAPLLPMGELLSRIPPQRADTLSIEDSGAARKPDLAQSEAPSAPIEKESVQTKAMKNKPLSPYAMYEALKPPTSPTPKQSTSPASKANIIDGVPTALDFPQTNLSESSNSNVEKEPISTELKKTRPLSPYICFEDLKPPTSPTPNPPIAQQNVTIAEAASKPNTDAQASKLVTTDGFLEATSNAVEVKKKRPLSPYTSYEDLKPPCSPSPTPSGRKEIRISSLTEEFVLNITPSSVAENNSSPNLGHHHSPYHVYEDFKPPTSPSPNAPFVSFMGGGPQMAAATTGNSTASLPISDDKRHQIPQEQKPLSPYTMYEDLKPPTSPMSFWDKY